MNIFAYWITLYFLLLSSFLRAEWVDVQEVFPDFYDSVVSTQGVSKSMEKAFFSYWTTQELRLLESAIYSLEQSTLKHGNDINKENFRKYTGAIFGVLGEISLASKKRKEYENQADITILNAFDIDEIKTITRSKHTIPDGIIYKLHEDFVEILEILESKMGNMVFDKKQARNYFNAWKHSGIHLYDESGTLRKFKPYEIRFIQNSEYTSIQNITFEEFLAFTVTIYSKNPVKKASLKVGKQVISDIPSHIAEKISDNFGKQILLSEDTSDPHQEIESDTHKELKSKIHKWFLSQKKMNQIHWPRSGLNFGKLKGKELKKMVRAYGGQVKAFVHLTSTKIKHLMVAKDALPQIDLIELYLIEATQTSHELLDTFKIYFSMYEDADGSFHGVKSGELVKENYKKLYENKSCSDGFSTNESKQMPK